jgi:hypothetical protein
MPLPTLAKLNIDIWDPKRAVLLRLSADPKLEKSITEIAEPQRVALRRLNEEPMWRWFSNENCGASNLPPADNEEPSRE